jgi:hypothetical protein
MNSQKLMPFDEDAGLPGPYDGAEGEEPWFLPCRVWFPISIEAVS